MRFDEIRPIIEGKLYAWAEWRQTSECPAPAISAVYQGQVGRVESADPTSPQERWVMKQAQLYEAGVIERAVRRCSKEQRELLFRRYVRRASWGEIAAALHIGRRTAYRIRDQVLAVVASALGMWEDSG